MEGVREGVYLGVNIQRKRASGYGPSYWNTHPLNGNQSMTHDQNPNRQEQ